MGKKWSEAQHKKFSATMRKKKVVHFPIEAIPARPLPRAAGAPRTPGAVEHDPKLILAYELVKLIQRLV